MQTFQKNEKTIIYGNVIAICIGAYIGLKITWYKWTRPPPSNNHLPRCPVKNSASPYLFHFVAKVF